MTIDEAIKKVEEGGGFLGHILVAEIYHLREAAASFKRQADYWKAVAQRQESTEVTK